MSAKLLRIVAYALCLTLLISANACLNVKLTKDNPALKLFKNNGKVGFSDTFTELADDACNDPEAWRQGMVSGNGEQGFVTSGAPFSDSYVFQNAAFLMPNGNERRTPDSVGTLNAVRQALVNGEICPDGQEYRELYALHPGGALRVDSRTGEKQKYKNYLRYTDYSTGEVCVYYVDEVGMMERRAFTSFADNAVVAAFTSQSGSRISTTISFDDPGTLANFGEGGETDCLFRTFVSPGGDCIAFVGHYPDYENTDGHGGFATVVYIRTDGGTRTAVELEPGMKSAQNVTCGANAIRVENAYGIYLIERSVPIEDLGPLADLGELGTVPEVEDLRKQLRKLADAHSPNGYFDYDDALSAHTAVYGALFARGELTLGSAENDQTNLQLLQSQRKSEALQPALLLREYNAARYLRICCGGSSVPRSCGMWTGEFNPAGGGKYEMDGGLELQTAALNSANMPELLRGYVYFILRQAAEWEQNAERTHGLSDAIQAPAFSDGVSAALTESSRGYPYNYYNAGAAWMLHPLYEALETYGDVTVPLPAEPELSALASVLSPSDTPLDEETLEEIEAKGSLDLRTQILLPLLVKCANYWVGLCDPAYYTDADGNILYREGKIGPTKSESFCILPGFSPQNTPEGADSPAAANAAIDIAACRDTLEMLLALIDPPEEPDDDEDEEKYDEDEDDSYGDEEEEETDGNFDARDYRALLDRLPPYLYNDDGSLREWAAAGFADNNAHRYLSHLYCAWPLRETQEDPTLAEGAAQALANRLEAGKTLPSPVHAALAADRLKKRDLATGILLQLEKSAIRYDSLLTNRELDGSGAFCTDYALGFLGIVNEALVYSEPGKIELLPCIPTSGFSSGSLAGLKTGSRAAVTLMSWDLDAAFVIADITSDVEQEIVVLSPLATKTQTLRLKAGETKTVTLDLNRQASE